ncbi:MAG: hypothetical protein AAFQ86_17785 [Bacteroidota bacterium]
MHTFPRVRIAALATSAFHGLTATGGGLAMLTGLERFPAAWLRGTPFRTYTVPALLLTGVGVGGLVATGLLAGRRPGAGSATLASGLLMAGFIASEVLLLDQDPPGPTPTETVYFASGLVAGALGLASCAAERRVVSPRAA